nr:hypothetical protein [Candidatus Sigynarchaeota archaeon]
MQACNIAVSCDESSGQVDIIYEHGVFLSNIDLVLYYDENWISCGSGELAFEKITRGDEISFDGMHLTGEKIVYSKHYRLLVENKSFSCVLHVILFRDANAIYLTATLYDVPGKFNAICGFIECGFPRAG